MHIGIVGCGQLSRMLALAGKPMGIRFSFVADEGEDSVCVDGLGKVVRWKTGDDIAALYQALGQPDRITVEKEQVDLSLVEDLQKHCPVHPNPKAFAAAQHRHREKQLLDSPNIPTSPYIYGQPDPEQLALPVVVKSCRDGYDGKNQWVLKTQDDLEAFRSEPRGDELIVEKFVPFEREVSQVSVRREDGSILHYPLAENRHDKGILRESIVPAPNTSSQLEASAQAYIRRIMEALDYVGVMAMECFVVEDGLLINELAPRVHNSGHWSQSGSATCQFENHIRAVADLPLGSTEVFGVAGMINLIGIDKPDLKVLTATSKLHWYEKSVRPGRKLGHINVIADHYDALKQSMLELNASVY